MPDQLTGEVILDSNRWLLSDSKELFLQLERPLDIIVDGKGTKTITTTGDIQLVYEQYDSAVELKLNLDATAGVALTVIGTQGTVKIID